MQALVLDGQTLQLPDADELDTLVRTQQLDGRPIAKGRLLEQLAALAKAVEGVHLAVGAVKEAGQPWWVYHVAEGPGGLQRVKIESQTCPACGWRGLTGNPRDFAIYIGTADPLAALQSHERDALVGCPACAAPLPRPAVFTALAP